jgi:hypothetical protein
MVIHTGALAAVVLVKRTARFLNELFAQTAGGVGGFGGFVIPMVVEPKPAVRQEKSAAIPTVAPWP